MGEGSIPEKAMTPDQTIPRGLMPFWMLSDASTTAEKITFMRRCHAGGIRALTMHPRAGNRVPFGSRAWWTMIRDLVTEAARLGMKLWLYDEDPYPSGAAGGWVMTRRPDLQARAFLFLEAPADLRPGMLWAIGPDPVVWEGLIPVRPGRGDLVNLTPEVGPVRQDWFAVEWDSRYYYSETPIYPCVRGAAVRMRFSLRVPSIPQGLRLAAVTLRKVGTDGPWGSLPDLLNPATFDVFRACGLDPYAEWVGTHFGTTIPGIFTDEAKPFGGAPFTADLFESFRSQFGYDLAEHLPRLFRDPGHEEDERVRLDYRQWIRDRFLEAFVRPYRQWCEKQGLTLVGHFSPEDDPIEETASLSAVMPIMKAMGWPGCDVIIPAVGDDRHPCLNLGSLRVSSLKEQWGHPFCSSETQALGDWTITTQETRRIYAWQKVLGVDRFFTHGFWTSVDGITNYDAPPDYGPSTSLFPGTAAVNEWLSRCDERLDGARPRVETAVVNNLLPFWVWGPGMSIGRLRRYRHSLWLTLLRGLQGQVGLHVVDGDDLAGGSVSPDGLTVGRWVYRTLLVPACDRMDESLFRTLDRAARAGLRVVWFGNGPRLLREAGGRMKPAPVPAGERIAAETPSWTWVVRSLPPVVTMSGTGRRSCYVRRFRARDGVEYLMAVNVARRPCSVAFHDECQRAWIPVAGLADGDFHRKGDRLQWEVPAGGVAFLTHGRPGTRSGITRAAARTRVTGQERVFHRLAPNALRLDLCRVTLKGYPSQNLVYPQPYWQRFPHFTATETFETFGGSLPVESTTHESDLRYRFTVESESRLQGVRLILDPRCARGRVRIYWDDRPASGKLVFPLAQIQPLRIPLPAVVPGRHALEFRFEAQNAMEGLLAVTWLEGEFDVRLRRDGSAHLAAPGTTGDSRKGWTEMGLPHYMGAGAYRWTERFCENDLRRGDWWLEVDEIRDHAELRVNDQPVGLRAWAPWRWRVPREVLRDGENRFELIVRSTAGNRLSLRYPRQPQGWIGGARLVQREGEMEVSDV